MNKASLLAELANNTYVMIKPSPVEGIGVFAIREIPRGCRNMFSVSEKEPDEYLVIPKAEISFLPPYAQQLVETYCLYDAGNYYVPGKGFKKMDLVNFLNHSATPNVISINDGEFFEALKDIKAGEELLVDYGTLVAEID